MEPCLNQGQCTDGINQYTCDCTNTGFEGDNCQINIQECDIYKPCTNGGTCLDGINDYDCQCFPGKPV